MQRGVWVASAAAVAGAVYFRESQWSSKLDQTLTTAASEAQANQRALAVAHQQEASVLRQATERLQGELKLRERAFDTLVERVSRLKGGIEVPPHCQHIVRYGLPSTEHVKFHQGYVSAYDRRNRTALWSCEHLTPQSTGAEVDRQHSNFQEDRTVPERFRARLEDYSRSGFDRGHLVPAGNVKFSQEAMNETFLLSNISPQVGNGFNRHYWARLEAFCRSLLEHYENVYICTGPLYLPEKNEEEGKYFTRYQVIGSPPNVSVPTHFYKTILVTQPKAEGEMAVLRSASFILPNRPIKASQPLSDFLVSQETLEHASGLEFWKDAGETAPLCVTGQCTLPSPDWWKKSEDESFPIEETLSAFLLKDSESVLHLPATLSPKQRKEAHDWAEKHDLDHNSEGAGSQRHVVVSRRSHPPTPAV
jgi:endonuclease G, mitochondrial